MCNVGKSSMNEKHVSDGRTASNPGSAARKFQSLRRIGIPLVYRKEIVQILKLAGPVLISELLVFLIPFVSTAFCGHLGKTELAGVALATAVINVSGIVIGLGLTSVCDTLMTQAFGSRNLKRVGVILQRSVLILLLTCCPCWAVLINTESILLAVKQSPAVARLSQLYVEIFMPALPAAFMFQLLQRYLQSQGIIWPQVFTGIISNVLNALINYIFLFVLDFHVVGSAAANTISQYFQFLSLWAYILWKGLHKPTWGGWSVECLQEWGSFTSLSLYSLVMICPEWWVYETGGFLAGLISEEELASQTVVNGLCALGFVIQQGLGAAASVRVGNALGAGDAKQAKLSCRMAMLCVGVSGLCMAVCFGASKDVITYIFTTDQQIRRRVAEVMPLFSPFHMCDAVAVVAGGVLRGAAKQKIAAVYNLLGFYLVGYPIGVSLMFAAKLGIIGLWSGLLVCAFLQASIFNVIICKLDWTKAAIEAQVRAGVQTAEKRDQEQAPETQSDLLEMTPTNHVGDLPGYTGDHDSVADYSTRVEEYSTHMTDHSPWQLNSDLEGLHERDGGTLTAVGEVLSFRQLVLRRGLALLAMLLILAAGILTNALLPAHLSSRGNETIPISPTVNTTVYTQEQSSVFPSTKH